MADRITGTRDDTETRKGAPDDLAAADTYRQLVQEAGHLLWTITADGLIDAEQGWRPFTGQSAEAVRGWGWLAAIHPDDRERVRRSWAEALATQGRYEGACRIRRADGAYRTFHVRGLPIAAPAGRVGAWAAFGADITAREEAAAAWRASEEARRAHEERLRAVVANAPIVLFAVDREGVFTLSRGRGLEALGIAPDAHVGQSYFALYGDLPESVATMRRALAGEPATTIERFRGLVFETRWMPIRDADGSVTGVIGVSADITARARAERERDGLERRTREVLDALLEMAQAAMQVPGDAGDAGASTQAVTHRLAVLMRNVLGCHSVSLIAVTPEDELRPLECVGLPPEQVERWRERIAHWPRHTALFGALIARLRAGETVRIDTTRSEQREMANPFGVERYLLAPMRVGPALVGLLSAEYGRGGEAVKREDIALVEAVAALAALVLERERLLHEREEARASALALRAANRRMDEFLGIASHELRTPLTGLRGSLQVMQRRLARATGGTPADEPATTLSRVSAFLERALRQSESLARLVDDLLDLSRIQAGQLQLRLAHCDLAALVARAVEEHRLLDPARTITLEAPDGPALVEADAERLSQVVDHFLDNALKYSTEEQPVAVGVTVDGAAARVWVRDAGPGIPATEQERIWERFYRAEGTEHRSGSSVGLGLGLYLSRTIIERHGGQVGVESAAGAGATFWFRLPLVTPADAGEAAAGKAESS